MAVCYDKLLHMLIDKKMTTTQLKEKAGFSSNIIMRIKQEKYISMDSIERICKIMNCGVDEILEFVDDQNPDKDINEELSR